MTPPLLVNDVHSALNPTRVSRLLAPTGRDEILAAVHAARAAGARLALSGGRHAMGGTPVIYGTIRLIERDDETVLGWAREPWACVIFNLHCEHNERGLARAADAFRGLIDIALALRGSYFLTYHRWATREQVEAAHPRFREFLAAKRAHDPEERFTSNWYRHHRDLLQGLRSSEAARG